MVWLRTLLGIVALVTLALVAYPPSVLALIEVRSGPGVTYEVMAKVSSGGSYVVVAQEQDWYKIQLPDGREGWIHRYYAVQVQPPTFTPSRPIETGTAPPMSRRTALVIGNGAYEAGQLQNAVKDATDITAMLSRLGFEVTLLRNAALREMEEAVHAFNLRLREGGMGLLYFAGHGVQAEG